MNLQEASGRLLEADLIRRVSAALDAAPAWIVGGAVRDAVLNRPVSDLDLVVQGPPEKAARAVAADLGGFAFELSAEFPTWRASDRDGNWQVDLASLRGGDLVSDLQMRDFTVGAMAVSLTSGEGFDPYDGLRDLQAGTIRAVGPDSFSADPLRLMRAARLAAQFGWQIDPETMALGRRSAPAAAEPAGERVLAEFGQLMASAAPVSGLQAMDDLGLYESVFPEIAAIKGVVQGPNHHLDVYGHTVEVLEGILRIESDLEAFTGESAPAVRMLLNEDLADGLSRSTGLRLGALFHDCAKPQTRKEVDGFVGFRGHDREGAQMIRQIFKRLKSSRRLADYVSDLALHHLILGFMVPESPLDKRQVYTYLNHTDPVSVDVTLLTVADRLAARGSAGIASDRMIEGHLELAREMVADGLRWRQDGPPAPFLPGDELAAELGIDSGPELGRIIGELSAARYAGEIASASEAVDLARRLLKQA